LVAFSRRIAGPAVAIALAIGVGSPASADQVTDQLQRAETAYGQKNFAAALTALTTAQTLIRQVKAETWKAVLPDPPPGWTAEDPKVITVGPALLGGGSSTERRYRRPGGTVDISLIADSPMLQSAAMLLGAGMLVSGSELLIIEGQRASYDANENSLQAIVADKVLVKVQGSKGVDKQTLQDFFRAIKLSDIEKAAQ
jgi:hypothetical protein